MGASERRSKRREILWGVLAALGPLLGCQALDPHRPTVVDLYLANPYPLEVVRPEPPRDPIDVKGAVQLALGNYPAIRAAQGRVQASESGVELAQTNYLPRVDLLWQEIRATRNNFSGTLLPNPVLPGISGSVLPNTSWNNGWMNGAGALFSYEPFDFGYRSALVDVARAGQKQAKAEVEVTRLEVAMTAAEAFLGLLAAQETARAAQANVERREVFAQSVRALVNQQLRPGADASRADAELAQAQIFLIQAQQLVSTGRTNLIEAMGFTRGTIAVAPGPLLQLPFRTDLPSVDLNAHPLTQSQSAVIETLQARERALDKAFYPRFNLQFGLNGRGSEFDSSGRLLDGDEGLLPDRGNWIACVSIAFPALDFLQIGARRRIEESNERAERARMDQLGISLRAQESRVRAFLQAAQEIALKTPVQLKAAQDAQTQATIRYQTGLGTITDVAEAQQLLARAEIDDAVARLGIWRALSAAARVQGDVAPFLQVVESTPLEKRK
ncbi:MAG TPA: TolC family protein [Planctomycetota bacterium]|nr:TolC family protein [Planctomycetota bacterium]